MQTGQAPRAAASSAPPPSPESQGAGHGLRTEHLAGGKAADVLPPSLDPHSLWFLCCFCKFHAGCPSRSPLWIQMKHQGQASLQAGQHCPRVADWR